MTKPTIIIYGAAGGIGSECARLLFDQGYGLHLAGRDQDRLESLGRELDAQITSGDVNSPDLFERVNKEVTGDVGGIIYAVGSINLASIRRFNEKDAVTDYRVNALGAAMAVQASVTRLKKNKSASSVVLFSSVAVQKGFPMHASISMAKGAVEGLTRSLAAELAPKIRVNAIAPSVTRTPLSDKLLTNEDLAASIEKQHPLKRLGDAQDIASMAAFLISEQAAWITGQVISVDGGRSSLESR